MKRSAALRKEPQWAVTTPDDRARIQQKISQAIREAKTRPGPFSSTREASQSQSSYNESARNWSGRLRNISEGWATRAGSLGQQVSRRAQELGSTARQWSSSAREKGRPNPEAEIWKGVAAGVAAGLVGTIFMTGFMGLCEKSGEFVKEEFEDRSRRQQQEQRGEQEPPTDKVASDLSKNIFQRELEGDTKRLAGNAVHYGFGAAIGGIYGALAELYPALTTGHGTLYGSTVWLGADELALPALGYTPSPQERAMSEHIYGASSHVVYGLVTETVRGALRNWLD